MRGLIFFYYICTVTELLAWVMFATKRLRFLNQSDPVEMRGFFLWFQKLSFTLVKRKHKSMYTHPFTDEDNVEIEVITIEGSDELMVNASHLHTPTGRKCAEIIEERIFTMIHNTKDEFIHSDTDSMWTEVTEEGEVIVTFSNGVTNAYYYIQPEVIAEIVEDELRGYYSEIHSEYWNGKREHHTDLRIDEALSSVIDIIASAEL